MKTFKDTCAHAACSSVLKLALIVAQSRNSNCVMSILSINGQSRKILTKLKVHVHVHGIMYMMPYM